jgi:hypothetical protein
LGEPTLTVKQRPRFAGGAHRCPAPAGRVQKNVASPYVKVKNSRTESDRVRLDAAPEMTDKVAAAMADKLLL